MKDQIWATRCGILVDHEPHDWQLFIDRGQPVPGWFRNHHCDGTGKYSRKPVTEDLLAATWPSHPLNVIELADAAAGIDPDYIQTGDRWAGFRAMIRQETAAWKESKR